MELVERIFFVLASIAAIGFLINGLDDLWFDTQFLFHLWRQRRKPCLALSQLQREPEQWIAICVPAWNEGGVVNKMAEYAARILVYERYDLFIGVYPNDPETNRCVDALVGVNPRIHKVTVPNPGPTSKADCLNAIFRSLRGHEVPGVREYRIIALHDAEDVLHPLVLKVYNYFVPRDYDMAQVPVFALDLPAWRYWAANTYIDDFSELHTKDMFVRQSIGGIVPSAGVGTAFTRAGLELLAARNGGDPFRVGNLTEDYEVGIRLKRAGLRAGMVSVPIERMLRRRQPDGSWSRPELISEVVAIREAFPKTFWTAVRQRSRWILGISFQTWEQTGWAGTWAMRYTLFRDRRAPLTHCLNILGYLILGYVIVQWASRALPGSSGFYVRPLFRPDTWLWKIMILDISLLGYRALHKLISVGAVYRWQQAVASIPRLFVGNWINFCATLRALKMYLGHRLFGKPIVWLKTAHTFPGEGELVEYSKSIEDLLVEGGLVTREQIYQALQANPGSSAPFALLRLGLLREKDFTNLWARQSGLDVRLVNPYQIPLELLHAFPEKQSRDLAAIPVGVQKNQMLMAFREPPGLTLLGLLAEKFGVPLSPVLAPPSHLEYARRRAYPRLVLPSARIDNQPSRFQQGSTPDPLIFLEAHASGSRTPCDLADLLVESRVLSEAKALRLWAGFLGCEPCEYRELIVDAELYRRLGAFFWWTHRMLPIQYSRIATAIPPHPSLISWIARETGRSITFVAELPSRIHQARLGAGLEFDPEQLLLNHLVARGQLRPQELDIIKTARTILAEPLVTWLRLQNVVSEEHLNRAFRAVSGLSLARPWRLEDVRRLRPAFAPGFSEETRCYLLEDLSGAVRVGMGQMPSEPIMREIYDRLNTCALSFEALSFPELMVLQATV